MAAQRQWVPAVAVLALLAGCGTAAQSSDTPRTSTTPGVATSSALRPPSSSAQADRSLPGVGPAWLAKIPAETTQVVLVVGAGTDATTSTVSFWSRSGSGWTQQVSQLAAHNGARGWTTNHQEGDERSPAGVFTLTYAGGHLTNPGTKLPYEYRPAYYTISGTFLGGNLAGAFNYVVGIDYNHIPGTPPSDSRHPLGDAAGGGIWFHVDHQSPTHACVSLSSANMVQMLQWLDPADHPVTVMGSAAELAS